MYADNLWYSIINMKNQQKGFVALVVVVIIALLAIGGGVYIYKTKKVETPSTVDTMVQQSTEIQQINTQTQTNNTQENSSNNHKVVTKPVAQGLPPFNFEKSLNTPAEKQTFLDEAKKRPSSELLSAWKQQITKMNYTQLDFIEMALSDKIKTNSDSSESKEIYSFVTNIFGNGTLDNNGTIRLVKWLGQGGGAPVVGILLIWFDQTLDKELQHEILYQLNSIMGKTYGQSAESISRVLETRWSNSTISASPNDPNSSLIPFFGGAIAKLGTSGGVKILLDEVVRGGQTRSQFKSNADMKSQFALISLSSVRSEASVALLAQGMHGSPEDMRLFASGETLANISRPASTKVLVDWAVQADDANAVLVEDWLSRLRDTDSRKIVRYLFIDPVTFRSEQVKQAVARVIKSYE